MSFLSQAWMLDKYGPRLAMKDLADVLGIAHGTLRNRLSNGVVREYVPYAEAHAMRAALENVMTLAARHRKEEWAGHMLRFCADAGVTGSPLRGVDAARAAQGGKT